MTENRAGSAGRGRRSAPEGQGVRARDLGGDELLRELGQLHRTRHETFRHGSERVRCPPGRTDELEREYLRRFPDREVDPRRLRDGEADDLDDGAGRDDGREERPIRDPGADLDGLGMPDIAEDQVPGTPGEQPDYEPMRESAPVEAPVGSLEWGTTAREAAAGEPLDLRLAREEPDEV
jgi:hypothetical protein